MTVREIGSSEGLASLAIVGKTFDWQRLPRPGLDLPDQDDVSPTLPIVCAPAHIDLRVSTDENLGRLEVDEAAASGTPTRALAGASAWLRPHRGRIVGTITAVAIETDRAFGCRASNCAVGPNLTPNLDKLRRDQDDGPAAGPARASTTAAYGHLARGRPATTAAATAAAAHGRTHEIDGRAGIEARLSAQVVAPRLTLFAAAGLSARLTNKWVLSIARTARTATETAPLAAIAAIRSVPRSAIAGPVDGPTATRSQVCVFAALRDTCTATSPATTRVASARSVQQRVFFDDDSPMPKNERLTSDEPLGAQVNSAIDPDHLVRAEARPPIYHRSIVCLGVYALSFEAHIEAVLIARVQVGTTLAGPNARVEVGSGEAADEQERRAHDERCSHCVSSGCGLSSLRSQSTTAVVTIAVPEIHITSAHWARLFASVMD